MRQVQKWTSERPISDLERERIKTLFASEFAEYAATVPFEVYDLKEILTEKIRATMTRRDTKARDFLDIFFVYKKKGN
ncbi:MAG TPA: nucleotidyl transferase AbiEii/AbiGii toxin family protein [Nitrososphaera sp.]|nr:nucleotidyl transferase AbiEii/AbiGii toxin family protein [Nitrososphaera sp.]